MLKIITLPIPSLHERSKEVDRDFLLSKETQQLITDMIPTMYAADGIGLAAPQVARNIRICTIGKDAIPKEHAIWNQIGASQIDIALVNPVWERTSKKTHTDTEGCLSVPGASGRVKRYKDISVTAWDRNGKELQFNAVDFFARVIQHEVDHLNGILFIDKATSVKTIDPDLLDNE